jgi:hypothetical protein
LPARAAYPVEPKFVAVAFVKNASERLRSAPGNYGLLRRELAKSVSEDQRKFNRGSHFVSGVPKRFVTRPDSGETPVCLIGVSLEDTKTMVRSTLEWGAKPAYLALKKAEAELAEHRKNQADQEKKIAGLTQEREEAAAKLEASCKAGPYQDIDDAQLSVQEFTRASLLVEVEIVGIQAKFDMIKQQEAKLRNEYGVIPDSIQELLLRMRLSEEIELAGALARQNTIKSHLSKASDFVKLWWRSEELAGKLEEIKVHLAGAKREISRLEKTLANPHRELRQLEVADNKVMIYSVILE